VVTDQDRAGKREVDVGPHVLHRFARQAFESAHVVIRHEPDGAAKKSEGARRVSAVSSQDVAKRVQWRERRVAAVGPFDHGGAFARRHPPATIKSDERVATRGFAQAALSSRKIARH